MPQKNIKNLNDHKKFYMIILESKGPLLWANDQSGGHIPIIVVVMFVGYKFITQCQVSNKF